MVPAGQLGEGNEKKLFLPTSALGHNEASMARAKKASKRTAQRTNLSVVGAAGVSLAMAGGASATAPADAPSQDTAPRPVVFLGEEEIFDVSLATFYVFDKEYVQPGEILQVAAHGCGGCRGCAARGCAVRGCGGCGCRGCRGCGVRIWGGCGCVACGGGCGCCIGSPRWRAAFCGGL